MPIISVAVASIASVPDLHRLITRDRGNALAIGRPRYRPYSIRMPMISEDVASITSIPELYRIIPRARSDALAIGRPRHRVYLIRMTMIGIEDGSQSRAMRGYKPGNATTHKSETYQTRYH